MDSKKVWFVTGASKGLGLTLILELLKAGHRVAATSRSVEALQSAVGEWHRSDRFLPLEVSLVNESQVKSAIESALTAFGAIDVVVNNAGYGHFGTLEELSDQEARQNFDINVFGALNVIRRVMPHFRIRRSGVIFNIGSIGGYTGSFPGWGIYCATKFAVAGFTEALSAEVKPFGVHAVAVYPGYFRTSFLSAGSMVLPSSPIEAYEAARNSLALHQDQIDGKQEGDPVKAAAVLMEIADVPEPPLHLFLGQDAYTLAEEKIALVEKDLQSWKELTVATGFAW